MSPCPSLDESDRLLARESHGCDPLEHTGTLANSLPLLKGDHPHATANNLEQLAGRQEEIRVPRPTKALVAVGERLVDQYAIRSNRVHQHGPQRTVEIARDDNGIEAPVVQRPRRVLQVGNSKLDVRNGLQGSERSRVAIDRQNTGAA